MRRSRLRRARLLAAGQPRPGSSSLRERLADALHSSPARSTLAIFAGLVGIFTVLLSLPAATETGHRAPFADALFTATSAVSVTGLVTVDTATYWSGFGEVVILLAIQVGGLGVLTLASLLGLAVSRRLGLRQRLLVAAETKTLRLGEVASLLRVIVMMSLAFEAAIAAFLVPRFALRGEGIAASLWHGVFYAVSAFNNAGFVSRPEGLSDAVGDAWLTLPIAVGVFVGSLGFPVLVVLFQSSWPPSKWDLHSRLTVVATGILLVIAVVAIGGLEWTNRDTLGRLNLGDRVVATVFTAVMPRSGGFSVLDVGEMRTTTWLVTDALMFVGGGSASTAGGVRVTTLAVLFLAVVAEARGDSDVEVFDRRIPSAAIRIAVTVLLTGATVVLIGALAVLAVSALPLDAVLFEVISAFGTSGLSTGITPELPDSGKYILSALMFVGRTGTMTLAAALALRERRRLFRVPEERPIVG